MQADDGFRTLGHRGDLIDVEARGVGGQDRAGFADGVQLGEDVFLDVHALEHRLDYQIDVREAVGHRERAGDQSAAFLYLRRRDAAARGRPLIVLADNPQATIQRLLLLFDDHHRDANIGEVHGDATAHGTGTDDADLLDGDQGGVIWNIRNFLSLAFSEERIALRRRLAAAHQLTEQLGLDLDTFFEGQVHGGFDTLDVRFRGFEPPELPRIRLAEIGEDFRLATGGFNLIVLVADAGELAALCHHLAGKGQGPLAKLAFLNQLIGQAAS